MHNYLFVGVVVVLAVLSLILVFTDDAVFGFAQYSVGRCHLQDDFENGYESKNDCMLALKDLCYGSCPSNINDCVRVSRRACQKIGGSGF